MFTVLATVTLLGIVIITRPKVAMHNIPPSWWIPIAVVMIPGLVASQVFTFRAILKRKVPSPNEIAATHIIPSSKFRPITVFFWFSNYLISFVILVSLYKPGANGQFQFEGFFVAIVISSFLSTMANIYLMLLTRTISDNEIVRKSMWQGRHLITLSIAIVGIAYYYFTA